MSLTPEQIAALLRRAESFVNSARSFDWQEDRCVMTAVHLSGDLRQAIVALESQNHAAK